MTNFLCAPQRHGGCRTDALHNVFSLLLENVMPFIFLGCTVIVLYERIYNQRFWPNVECWIATKMPSKEGLVPATEPHLRIRVLGIRSARANDSANRAFLLDTWHSASTLDVIKSLSADDILVTNQKDKEINLKVVASLDSQIRNIYTSYDPGDDLEEDDGVVSMPLTRTTVSPLGNASNLQ